MEKVTSVFGENVTGPISDNTIKKKQDVWFKHQHPSQESSDLPCDTHL